MDEFMTGLAHDLAVEVVTVGAYVLGAVALACLAGWALRRDDPATGRRVWPRVPRRR